ncbi:hypothetical protein [Streptomyces sp. NRRL F-5630]|uniref:hypothetical protein n=1 Tax=Streptomyces sp. NRRL F-5630 TaxID=1463864 RepID=UPI0004C63222|nr:hypothetical protein [Streptomyces sp. NRRL F-5630]
MNARSRLVVTLANTWAVSRRGRMTDFYREAEELVDAFAHELAEEVRAWAAATYPAPRQQAPLRHVVDTAADLIDPSKETP